MLVCMPRLCADLIAPMMHGGNPGAAEGGGGVAEGSRTTAPTVVPPLAQPMPTAAGAATTTVGPQPIPRTVDPRPIPGANGSDTSIGAAATTTVMTEGADSDAAALANSTFFNKYAY